MNEKEKLLNEFTDNLEEAKEQEIKKAEEIGQEIEENSEEPIEEKFEDSQIASEEEIIDEAEVVETDDIENVEEENISFRANPTYIVDYFNKLSKRNSYIPFRIFLIIFLVFTGGLLVDEVFIYIGLIGIFFLIFFTIGIMKMNNQYSRYIKVLSKGESLVKVLENEIIIEEVSDRFQQKVALQYSDIVALEETEHLFIITTIYEQMHILDKKALEDKAIKFKNNVMPHIKTYNGQAVKKDEIVKGRYDFYEESSGTISVLEGKRKVSNTFFYVMTFFILLTIILVGFDLPLALAILFVPVGIIELIYIHKINKKMPKGYKIISEKVFSLIFTIYSGVIGIIGGLVLLIINLVEKLK